jgi:hypothetical protein
MEIKKLYIHILSAKSFFNELKNWNTVVYLYLVKMKNIVEIPVPRVEDLIAGMKRRENYALSRDLLAKENNNAIAKRLQHEAVANSESEKDARDLLTELVTEEAPSTHKSKKVSRDS